MPQAKNTPTEPAESHGPGPGIQKILVTYGLSIATMVVGTALYAPREYSERAFRLLYWWKRDPHPAPEEPTPSSRRRARP